LLPIIWEAWRQLTKGHPYPVIIVHILVLFVQPMILLSHVPMFGFHSTHWICSKNRAHSWTPFVLKVKSNPTALAHCQKQNMDRYGPFLSWAWLILIIHNTLFNQWWFSIPFRRFIPGIVIN
jgi:hypothetical protein